MSCVPWALNSPIPHSSYCSTGSQPRSRTSAVFHVVLFEPEIPGNAGNCIRLCANTGATLHLVKPLGFRVDDKSLKRSGLDYHELAELKIHANFDACVATLDASRLFAVETGAALCYTGVQYGAGDAFV